MHYLQICAKLAYEEYSGFNSKTANIFYHLPIAVYLICFHFDNPKHFANWKQNISFLVATCNGKAFSFSNSGPPATKQLKMHLLGIMGISFLKKEPIYYSNLTKAAKGFAEGIPSYFKQKESKFLFFFKAI